MAHPADPARRVLDDGRILDLMPLTFGRWRIGIGQPDDMGYEDVF